MGALTSCPPVGRPKEAHDSPARNRVDVVGSAPIQKKEQTDSDDAGGSRLGDRRQGSKSKSLIRPPSPPFPPPQPTTTSLCRGIGGTVH